MCMIKTNKKIAVEIVDKGNFLHQKHLFCENFFSSPLVKSVQYSNESFLQHTAFPNLMKFNINFPIKTNFPISHFPRNTVDLLYLELARDQQICSRQSKSEIEKITIKVKIFTNKAREVNKGLLGMY